MITVELLKEAKSIIELSISSTYQNCKINKDTRTIEKGDLYLALSGENFDGHKFISKAIEAGASGVIFSDKNEFSKQTANLITSDLTLIQVEDTLQFLQDLANQRRKAWSNETGGFVICITGSNGKTTTKEMISHLMKSQGAKEVYATKGNLNNQIGVPLSLLELENTHKFAIIEIGTNHPGEIKRLCEIADPDFGLITNIGDSHLEFFENREGVFNEKRALFDWVRRKNGFFIINGFDPYLSTLEYKRAKKVSANGDFELKVEADKCVLKIENNAIELKNENIWGEHLYLDLGLSFIMSYYFFPNFIDDLKKSAQSFAPTENRASWKKANGKNIFLDAYNANPSSMEASIKSFVSFLNNNKVNFTNVGIVVGDMNELGDNSEKYHDELGKLFGTYNFGKIFYVGRYYESFASGINREIESFKDVSLLKSTNNPLENDDLKYLFIKGSRSLVLEKLLQ